LTDEEIREPEPARPATERAEELVDRMARGAGYLASFVGLRLLKGASLAREEAEDIWAEAQSLRRREGQGAEPDVAEPDVAEPDVAEPAAGGGDASRTLEATEAARRKAEEMGVDLTEVRGTGADGRITVEDVKRTAKAESS
jgi:pyruvate/2-oxoglutarate dehydrogenase complex dihydrolipoamide acyltransferase (E2) component